MTIKFLQVKTIVHDVYCESNRTNSRLLILELKETMARVGADLKQKFIDSVRNTWNSVFQLAHFHKPDNNTLEREIDKVVEEQLQQAPSVQEQNNDDGGADIKMGNLNGGRRIDYVLQEAPFEYINEYIFALTSHVCYWLVQRYVDLFF